MTLAAYGLGSGIGVAIYDPVARVGGLLHAMLPDSRGEPFEIAATALFLISDLSSYVNIPNKGHITKRVTEVRSPELLAFDVIEQSIGYERDVRLISGSFELSPDGATHTRITLNTTYQPLLGPRWAWALGEDYAIHTLHSHVLEGMRLHAETSNRPTALLPDTSAHP